MENLDIDNGALARSAWQAQGRGVAPTELSFTLAFALCESGVEFFIIFYNMMASTSSYLEREEWVRIMPTYEYECRSCNHQFDTFQSITAKPLKICPKCKKAQLRRLIGKGAGIIFKGSGFYQTDYRSDHYRKQSAADKPQTETSKPASKEGTKTTTPAKTEKAGSASAS